MVLRHFENSGLLHRQQTFCAHVVGCAAMQAVPARAPVRSAATSPPMARASLYRRDRQWLRFGFDRGEQQCGAVLAFVDHNFAEKDAGGGWPVCSLAASSSATLGTSRKLSQNKSLIITRSPRNTSVLKPRITTPTSRRRITENPRNSSNLLMLRRLIPSSLAG